MSLLKQIADLFEIIQKLFLFATNYPWIARGSYAAVAFVAVSWGIQTNISFLPRIAIVGTICAIAGVAVMETTRSYSQERTEAIRTEANPSTGTSIGSVSTSGSGSPAIGQVNGSVTINQYPEPLLPAAEIIRRRDLIGPWQKECMASANPPIVTLADPRLVAFINHKLEGTSEVWRLTSENVAQIMLGVVWEGGSMNAAGPTALRIEGGGGNTFSNSPITVGAGPGTAVELKDTTGNQFISSPITVKPKASSDNKSR